MEQGRAGRQPRRLGQELIPRRFHRIWLDEPIPARFEAFWEGFKDLHPGWAFETWRRSEDLEWIRNRALFERQETHAGRSDILRYEILARFGGIYVDTDVEPLRSFELLAALDRPFAAWEDERLICPTVMGGPAGHPALEDLVASLGSWAERRFKRPPNQQTGPHFLTARWARRSDVELLEPEAFYPVHWSEKAKLGGPYPEESFAVHHWAAGWLPGGPPQKVAP